MPVLVKSTGSLVLSEFFFISLIVYLFVLNINMKLNFHAYCCLVLNLMLFFCVGEFVSGFDGVRSFHFVGLVVEGHLFAN